jgi:hypothetical protein
MDREQGIILRMKKACVETEGRRMKECLPSRRLGGDRQQHSEIKELHIPRPPFPTKVRWHEQLDRPDSAGPKSVKPNRSVTGRSSDSWTPVQISLNRT